MNNNRGLPFQRWLYVLLTVLCLLPILVGATSLFGVTTVHADPTDDSNNPDIASAISSAKASAGRAGHGNLTAQEENSIVAAITKQSKSESSASVSADTGSSNTNAGDGSQNDQQSAWNMALTTLSQSVLQAKGDGVTNPQTSNAGQADANSVATGDASINIWGFMGTANTDVWTKNDNSSWATSYEALLPIARGHGTGKGSLTALQSSYQIAARFAYALQSTGLDKEVKSGFGNTSVTQVGLGWILQIAYYVLTFSNSIFNLLVLILQDLNPLHWVISAAENSQHFQGMSGMDNDTSTHTVASQYLQPLANAVATYYNWFTGWGWLIMGIFLAGGLGMAALGFTIGQSGGFSGQGHAFASVMVSLLKRLFVYIMVPLFAASIYDMATTGLANTFSNNQSSVTDYAVYGAFDDYHNWVMHTRLLVPDNLSVGGLSASFNEASSMPLSHSDLVVINHIGAGDGGDSLYNTITTNASHQFNQNQFFSVDSNEVFSNSLQQDVQNSTPSSTLNGFGNQGSAGDNDDGIGSSPSDLLSEFTEGNKMTAADYASAEANAMNLNNSQELDQKLMGPTYNSDGVNAFNGSTRQIQDTSTNTPFFYNRAGIGYNNTNFQETSNDVAPGSVGGLSTFGLYNYMLTTANDTGLTIANTENLADDVSLPQHYSVNLAGTSLGSTGNAIWALGLMGGLAIIVVGYALAILKSIVNAIPAMTFALFHTAFASVKGGVQLISVCTGVLLGTLGSAFLYRFAQIAFISLAQYSDSIIHSSFFNTTASFIVNVGHHSGALGLSLNLELISGAMNIIYGVFLLFLAFMLVRYRGVIIGALSSLVEETVNKILASFGTMTGGSAGTRGAISQNTDTSSSTWGNNASSIISRGGMGMLATAGGGAGLAALGKGKGGAKASAGKKGAGMGNSGKGNVAKHGGAMGTANTSAGKTGNAAKLTGTGGKGGGRGNAAGAMSHQNAERNGSPAAGKGFSGGSHHSPAGQGARQGQGQGQSQHQGNVSGDGSHNGQSGDGVGGVTTNLSNNTAGDMQNAAGNTDMTNQNSQMSQLGGQSNTNNSDSKLGGHNPNVDHMGVPIHNNTANHHAGGATNRQNATNSNMRGGSTSKMGDVSRNNSNLSNGGLNGNQDGSNRLGGTGNSTNLNQNDGGTHLNNNEGGRHIGGAVAGGAIGALGAEATGGNANAGADANAGVDNSPIGDNINDSSNFNSNLGDINNSDQNMQNLGGQSNDSNINNAGNGGMNNNTNSNLNTNNSGNQFSSNTGNGSTGGVTTNQGGTNTNTNNANNSNTQGGGMNSQLGGSNNMTNLSGNGVTNQSQNGSSNGSTQIGGTNTNSQIGGTNTNSQLGGSNMNANTNSQIGGTNTNSQLGGSNMNTNTSSQLGGTNMNANTNSQLGGLNNNNNSQLGGSNMNTNTSNQLGGLNTNANTNNQLGGSNMNTNTSSQLGGANMNANTNSQIGGSNDSNLSQVGGNSINSIGNSNGTTSIGGTNNANQIGGTTNQQSTNLGGSDNGMTALGGNNNTTLSNNGTSQTLGGNNNGTTALGGNTGTSLGNNEGTQSLGGSSNTLGTNDNGTTALGGNTGTSLGNAEGTQSLGGSSNTLGTNDNGTTALGGNTGTSLGNNEGTQSLGGSSNTLGSNDNGMNALGNNGGSQSFGGNDQGSVNTGTGDTGNMTLGGNSNLASVGTPQSLQTQMGDVQSAQTDAQQAQTLAQQNPDNSTLQQRATDANQNLASVQGNALGAYNSQPVGTDTPQSQWLGGNAGSGLSVGSVNESMNSVYSAQQNLDTAQSQFGAGSPQVQGAQDALTNARQGAVNNGLSSSVVNNPKAVESAHSSINNTTNSLKSGTWKPTGGNTGSVGGGSHGSSNGGSSNGGSQRSIGI